MAINSSHFSVCSKTLRKLFHLPWIQFLLVWNVVIRYICSSLFSHCFPTLAEITSTESVRLSNHLILCCPLVLLPSVLPSIRVFSSDLTLCIRWTKIWSFSFTICLFNDNSGLISFRMDWFYLLATQGSLKIFFSTIVQKHQLSNAQPSSLSDSQICTWLLEKTYLWLYRPLLAKWCLYFLTSCLVLSSIFFQGASVF